MSDNTETVIIHKYASRRLYNTSTSNYVTLDDICDLIKKKVNIKIIDKDTGLDQTNQYLLQIILNFEEKSNYKLPGDFLVEIIRNYNSSTQNILPVLMSKALDSFKSYQEIFVKDVGKKTKNSDFNFFPQNMMENWISFNESFLEDNFKTFLKNKNNVDNTFKHMESESLKKEVDELKKQLNEINKILNK